MEKHQKFASSGNPQQKMLQASMTLLIFVFSRVGKVLFYVSDDVIKKYSIYRQMHPQDPYICNCFKKKILETLLRLPFWQ